MRAKGLRLFLMQHYSNLQKIFYKQKVIQPFEKTDNVTKFNIQNRCTLLEYIVQSGIISLAVLHETLHSRVSIMETMEFFFLVKPFLEKPIR